MMHDDFVDELRQRSHDEVLRALVAELQCILRDLTAFDKAVIRTIERWLAGEANRLELLGGAL